MTFRIGDTTVSGIDDGGADQDTLLVSGTGVLDFTMIAAGRLLGFEIINLETSAEEQTIVLHLDDVLALSDSTDVLFVTGRDLGTEEDQVVLTGGFTSAGSAMSPDGEAAMLYTAGAASVIVENDVVVMTS